MQTAKDHAPFEDVLRAAGAAVPAPPPPSAKESKRLEKYKPLRKSRPSIGNPIAQVMPSAKAHTRGQTIDVVSAEVHLSFTVPTSVSTPQFPFKISQVNDSEKVQSQRGNGAQVSTVGVLSDIGPLMTAGSVVPSKASRLASTDSVVGPMFSLPLHPPEQAISDTPPAATDSTTMAMTMTMMKNNNNSNSEIQVLETQPTQDHRHRSLQKIKERKRNASRGTSTTTTQFDERHVCTSSTSLGCKPSLDGRTRFRSSSAAMPRSSYSHSRSSHSLLGPSVLALGRSDEPVSRSLTLSSQIRYHGVSMERTTRSSRITGGGRSRSRSRSRRERGSGNVGSASADERAVQSDSGMTMVKRERNVKKQGGRREDFCESLGYDDTVLLSGREMRKVNLSRDYLVRRESGKVQNGR